MQLNTQTITIKTLASVFLFLGLGVLVGCSSKPSDNSAAQKPQSQPKKPIEEPPKTEPIETEEKTEETHVSAKGTVEVPYKAPSPEELTIERSIEEIKKLGGKAEKNKNGDVDKVELTGEEITDDHLVLLQPFYLLDTLDLTGTRITDEGLKHLKGLEFLRYLYLLGTDVTDAGVVELQGHSRLEWLCLDETKVSDKGVKHLEPLGRLVMLHLVTQADITDACIDSLVKLKELKELKIEGTKITQDGRARLEKALPGIQFIGTSEEGIPID